MDRNLRKVLTECIRDIETGARDVEGCLQRHAEWAAELRPHLELWSGLNAAAKAEPNLGGQQRGQQRLHAAVSEAERKGGKRMIPFLTPALAKAGALVVAAVLVIGGAAGASAALGGPDVAGEVLSGIGISNASDTGKEHAQPNGRNGASDTGQGTDITPEAEKEQERERDRTPEDPSNAGESIDKTPEANQEQEQTQEQTRAQTQDKEQEQTQAQTQDKEQEQTQEQTQAQTQDKEQEQTQEQEMERAFEGSGNAGDSGGNADGQGG